MRVLMTGATGVIGREAVPRLLDAGHQVRAVARREEDRAWLESSGASPLSLDLFDPEAIASAMPGTDAVIHYATAIPPLRLMTRREAWRTNDLLRSEAARLLVDAAAAHGVGRFLQQSVSLVYADGGHSWLTETSPVAPPWEVIDSALTAERHVARFAESGGEAVVMRLARVYGPGAASIEYLTRVGQRRVPIVGQGENFVSSIHVEDAATALVAALSAPPGIYNVADDEPVTSRQLNESLAALLGAPRPRRIPRWIARMAVGSAAALLTVSHRISNRKLRQATGWAPRVRSVLDGWAEVVA